MCLLSMMYCSTPQVVAVSLVVVAAAVPRKGTPRVRGNEGGEGKGLLFFAPFLRAPAGFLLPHTRQLTVTHMRNAVMSLNYCVLFAVGGAKNEIRNQRTMSLVQGMLASLLVLFVCVESQQLVNHYQVLNVKEDASLAEIKRAYRDAALVLHPDKRTADSADHKTGEEEEEGVGGMERTWVDVVEAYSTLKDAEKRKVFDEELAYFRAYGRMRWTYRYRIYPRTNVWVVLISFIAFTLVFQWWYGHWYHRRMQTAARMTKELSTFPVPFSALI